MEFVTQRGRSPDQFPSVNSIDRYEFSPDGTLKIWQGLQWRRGEFRRADSTPRAEAQAAADQAALKETLEAGKWHIARWAAAVLATVGLFGTLTGLITVIRSHWGRPDGYPLSARIYIVGTILMAVGIICIAWNSASRIDANFSLFESAEFIPGFVGIWTLWAIAIGVVGPLRIASMKANERAFHPHVAATDLSLT